MDEAEWLSSNDPAKMLRFVYENPDHADIACCRSDRKLRLFACACARQVWHLLTDPRSRNAVEVAERHADGEVSVAELAKAKALARKGTYGIKDEQASALADEAEQCCEGEVLYAASYMTRHPNGVPLDVQANLLRGIVDNPFRKMDCLRWQCLGCGRKKAFVLTPDEAGAPSFERCNDCGGRATRPIDAWLTPTVLALAEVAYRDRPQRRCDVCAGSGEDQRASTSGDCPVCRGEGVIDDGNLDPLALTMLADALEEAGCVEESLLRHLRGQPSYYATIEQCGTVCPVCGKTGRPRHGGPGFDGDLICKCGCTWTPGTTNRITREVVPVPIVRGDWALDLVLGKE